MEMKVTYWLTTFMMLAGMAFGTNPTLTIDRIDGNSGVLTIWYTTSDPEGEELITADCAYSTDGANWHSIGAEAISNNGPKLPGSSYITWDTERGANNLAAAPYDSVHFRMCIKDLGETWRTVVPMPSPRDWPVATVVNGKIYVIGGSNNTGWLSSVEAYDPSKDQWHSAASMPTQRCRMAVAEVGGKIYVRGGQNESRYLTMVEEYDPVSNRWRQVSPMPTGREHFTATAVNSKIYAMGGYAGGDLNTVEEYDPSTDEWRAVASMPIARWGFASTNMDEHIYVAGWGMLTSYDPIADEWQQISTMATNRHSLGLVHVDNQLYAIGGAGSSPHRALDTAERYDPDFGQWSSLSSMPVASRYLAVVTVADKIYAIGGSNTGNDPLSIVQEYIPTSWQAASHSVTINLQNHLRSIVTFPEQHSSVHGEVVIQGSAEAVESTNALQSWVVEFAPGDDAEAGFRPIMSANQPVADGKLGVWNTTTLADGVYTVRLRVIDAHAQVAFTTLTLTVDNTPPDAPVIHVNSGGATANYTRSRATLHVTGYAEPGTLIKQASLLDTTGDVIADVQLLLLLDSTGELSGEIPGLDLSAMNSISLSITIADAADNDTVGISSSLSIDDNAPTVHIHTPIAGAHFNRSPILVQGDSADTFSGIQKLEIHTGFAWEPVAGVGPEWSYNFTPPVADIPLVLQVRATDNAGNETLSEPVTIQYLTALPAANLAQPVSGTQLAGRMNITGTADDMDRDLADLQWTLEYAPGADANNGWVAITQQKGKAVRGDQLAEWDVNALPDGPYTLRLTVQNALDKVSVKCGGLFKSPATPETPYPPNQPATVTTERSDGKVILHCTNFSDPNATDIHAASQWQVSGTSGDFSHPIFDSGRDTTHLTALTLPRGLLNVNTIYVWQVRHQDDQNQWSTYSKEGLIAATPSSGVIGAFLLDLNSGLNMISIPVRTDAVYTARRLSEELSATLVMRLDAETQRFIPYIPGYSDGDGFVLQGGEGYIVNVLAPQNITFTGTVWNNAAPTLPMEPGTWAFALAGNIAVETPVPSSILVVLSHPHAGWSLREVLPGTGGSFTLGTADITRHAVVSVGDRLELRVQDAAGHTLAEQNIQITERMRHEARLILPRVMVRTTPAMSQLLPNFPNPFNPETWIPYVLAEPGEVILRIFDAQGYEVRRLELGWRSAGWYDNRATAAHWNGRNHTGEQVSSGAYWAVLQASSISTARRLLLLK